MTTSTASSQIRISVACNVCTMYIVFLFETDECQKNTKKKFACMGGKKDPDVTDCDDFDNLFLRLNRTCLKFLLEWHLQIKTSLI